MKATAISVLAMVAIAAASGAVVLDRVVMPASVLGSCPAGRTAMARLDLLFGLGRADSGAVSEEEWQSFLAAEVSPRFPDGLTVLPAFGQWKNASGTINQEKARVLLIWYKPSAAAEANIETIRQAYKVRFGQESVMRVDGNACVSF
jgi:hypothetical protein